MKCQTSGKQESIQHWDINKNTNNEKLENLIAFPKAKHSLLIAQCSEAKYTRLSSLKLLYRIELKFKIEWD